MEFYRHRSYRPFWKWDTPCLFEETRHLLCVWISALPGNINLSMQPRTCRESSGNGMCTSHFSIQPRTCGDSLSGVCTACVCAMQPRTCGESVEYCEQSGNPLDTTPHMRGIRHRNTISMQKYGYNPAHARNPTWASSLRSMVTIQPRTCGESSWWISIVYMRMDTPPHMRGIMQTAKCVLRSYRYNPAHAGNPRPCNTAARAG